MFSCFHGESADQVWLAVAAAFRGGSRVRPQISRVGATHEIFRAALTVDEPRQRWVVSRAPPINPAFALAEVVWILAGRDDASFLSFFNRQLPLYCGTRASLYGAYGSRMRRHLGFDQLERAAAALEKNPDTRQVTIQIWDAVSDLPDVGGAPRAEDIPCNVMSLLKVRDGRLEFTEVLRSNDVFRGLPYNLVQFTTLQEVLAGWMGVGVGSYGQVVDSLHVYDDDLTSVLSAEAVVPEPNTDSLAYPQRVAARAWAELAGLVDRLVARSCRDLVRAPPELDVPEPYRNVAAVLCAEAARRDGKPALGDDIMRGCTNAALNQLWRRWTARVAHGTARSTAH